MKKFNAFTLAEVLITLGIIGVVAAMTMPTLINQTNGAQYKAAYKKALSAISQGVTLNVALDGGSFADTIQGEAGKTTAGNGKTDDTKTEGTTVGSLLNSRMNIVKATGTKFAAFPSDVYTCTEMDTDGKTCKTKKTITPDTYLFFNDGSMFGFDSTSAFGCTEDAAVASDNKPCSGVIDVNGEKGPNKVVKCDSGKDIDASCVVTNPTDIYPVVFYDQTVVPASDAAKAVLYGK